MTVLLIFLLSVPALYAGWRCAVVISHQALYGGDWVYWVAVSAHVLNFLFWATIFPRAVGRFLSLG